ncbi:MAG TPA: PAS domain-containing protein [Caldithrix abyssi]|uniref:histidine kinase n=1 Tax=Caldithrix abyssi TaxID=187145 RepID=A0A7V4U2Q1_CALAY|nr:PAS domain-containing protein [Caldithrix abyssi]
MIYKEKVLLLHRNALIQEKIFNYLHENDYAVIMANNAENTFSLAKSMKPDIILWGDALTTHSKQVIRKIKSSPFGQNIPIIALIPDVELFERYEIEKDGISDVLDTMPKLPDLKLKIRSHLANRRRILQYEDKLRRLRALNELEFQLIQTREVIRACDLVDDYILNTYGVQALLTLVFNNKTKEYDYKSFLTPDTKIQQKLSTIFELKIWQKYFFANPKLETGRIVDHYILELFSTIGLQGVAFYQFPLQAMGKQIGFIIAGIGDEKDFNKEKIDEISQLCTALSSRVLQIRSIFAQTPVTREDTSAVKHLFLRLNEDEISNYLSQQLLSTLRADVCIYFNYNEGFRFLYPQYCYRSDKDENIFEDEKPPVLMLKDYPTFEQFLESRKMSVHYNLSEKPRKDLQAMAELAGKTYNSLLIFTVKVGNEIKGFFLVGAQNGLKRFTRSDIHRSEQMIQRATSALIESRVVRQAQVTIKQLDRIFDLSKELTLENDIEDLLKKIGKAIRRTLGWNIVLVERRNLYNARYENVCALGLKESEFELLKQTYPDSLYLALKDHCYKISNSCFYDHEKGDGAITPADQKRFQRSIGKEWDDEDWILVPIQSRGRELGYIAVNDPVERVRPTEEKVRSIEYFANQAAVALENASLYENLKSSELKYRLLAETMTMGLVTCDFNGSIIYVNKSLSNMLKYERSESLLQQNIFDLCSNKTRNDFEKGVLQMIKSGKDEKKNAKEGIEIELLANDNTYIPFKIYLTDYYQQTKKVGFLGVLSDMRPQRRIERLKADFNSMIVHDLRSPLNIIQGYIDIVRNQVVGQISEEQSDLLFIAKENVDKVLKLIDNFMTASKMEAGKFDLEMETHSLNSVIEAVYEHNLVLAQKKDIEMSIDLDPNIALMEFDKMRIEQVLSNYISNAIKFTDKGGKVEIRSKLVKEYNELTSEESMAVHVAVKDSGVGIPYDEQDKVFNKYEQTEAGKDASLKGTGLGLAICKEIISLHKGEVWLESEPGKGSTFYFSLPIKPLKI